MARRRRGGVTIWRGTACQPGIFAESSMREGRPNRPSWAPAAPVADAMALESPEEEQHAAGYCPR
jgi:hypothetical protein